MSQQVDREGTFRANIVEYGLKEVESGSLAISIRALLLEMFEGGEWQYWEQFDFEAFGDIWVVKKDGGINEARVKDLVTYAGWDGNLESVANQTWKPTKCQVVVKRDDYKGVTRFKIEFLNDYERTPGAVSNVSSDKARELQTRFGSQLRAITGNVKRVGGGPTPGSKPPAPPSRPQTPPLYTDPTGVTNSDIPF